MRIIFFLFVLPGLILSSCSHNRSSKIVEIEYNGKDTCVFLVEDGKSYMGKRGVEVLENTISDTILLGLSVIPSKYIGFIYYLQVENKTDEIMYHENGEHNLPKTDRICLRPKKNIRASGKIKLKIFL